MSTLSQRYTILDFAMKVPLKALVRFKQILPETFKEKGNEFVLNDYHGCYAHI